jgi:hypothetical protein
VTQIDSLPPVADNDHWLGWEPSTRQRHPWRIVAVILLFVVAVVAFWIYSDNPLAQSWQQDTGEFGSYVGTVGGVEAHFTTDSAHESALSPMAITVWNEPEGKFVVQFETEINNTGSHAVHVVSVGEPSFEYHVSGYRVSFFRNKAFPHEDGASFRPFTLAGHTERIVTVSYSQFCTTKAPLKVNGRAMPSGPTSLPVTFSVRGFTHTDDVPIAPFTFVAPSHC